MWRHRNQTWGALGFSVGEGDQCVTSSLGMGPLTVAWTRAGSNETLIWVFFFSYYPLRIQWVHGAILDARDLSRMLVFP